MTIFVLSPSVEAMKASAFSIPAASRASVSRPAPTVKWPPRSSQPFSSPTSSLAWDSGSSSRQETSWPSRNIARATEEPTRPQPTIRMNILRILVSDGRRYRQFVKGFRRGRQQHPAGGLLQHVLGRRADLVRLRGADPAQRRAAPNLGRRLAADDNCLGGGATRRLDDPSAGVAGADQLGVDHDVLVLVADLPRSLEGPSCLLFALRR